MERKKDKKVSKGQKRRKDELGSLKGLIKFQFESLECDDVLDDPFCTIRLEANDGQTLAEFEPTFGMPNYINYPKSVDGAIVFIQVNDIRPLQSPHESAVAKVSLEKLLFSSAQFHTLKVKRSHHKIGTIRVCATLCIEKDSLQVNVGSVRILGSEPARVSRFTMRLENRTGCQEYTTVLKGRMAKNATFLLDKTLLLPQHENTLVLSILEARPEQVRAEARLKLCDLTDGTFFLTGSQDDESTPKYQVSLTFSWIEKKAVFQQEERLRHSSDEKSTVDMADIEMGQDEEEEEEKNETGLHFPTKELLFETVLCENTLLFSSNPCTKEQREWHKACELATEKFNKYFEQEMLKQVRRCHALQQHTKLMERQMRDMENHMLVLQKQLSQKSSVIQTLDNDLSKLKSENKDLKQALRFVSNDWDKVELLVSEDDAAPIPDPVRPPQVVSVQKTEEEPFRLDVPPPRNRSAHRCVIS